MARFATTQLSQTDAMDTIADEVHNQVGAAISNATASPLTMTAAQALTGIWKNTTAGAFALTLPSAATVVAAMANCQVGSGFDLWLINTGNNTVTVTAGTGNTLDGQATATLATNTSNLFKAKVTNVTAGAEAVSYFVCLKTAS